jgi:serine protease Do
MRASTNSLIANAKKFGAPAGAVAAVLLAIAVVANHNPAHAASNGAAALGEAAPMDDNSISSLVALDNAVEAVAARVTPAVVNVSVTAKGSAQEVGDDDQDSGSGMPQDGIRQSFAASSSSADAVTACSSLRRLNTASAAASSFRPMATS